MLICGAAAVTFQVHVQSVAVDDMVSVLTRDTAPKRMRVWGYQDARAYAPPPPSNSNSNNTSNRSNSHSNNSSSSETSLQKVTPLETSSSGTNWLSSVLSRQPKGEAASAAPVLLGEFLLEQGRKSSRFGVYQQQQQPIRKISFEFLENFGNSRYTCVYRLRVHGSKAVLLGSNSSSSSN